MILVILLSALITFFIGYFFYKQLNAHPLKIGGYKIHHSLLGILLIVIGFIVYKNLNIISAVGIGIYLSHVFEEIFLNKISLVKAIFMFVTKK